MAAQARAATVIEQAPKKSVVGEDSVTAPRGAVRNKSISGSEWLVAMPKLPPPPRKPQIAEAAAQC